MKKIILATLFVLGLGLTASYAEPVSIDIDQNPKTQGNYLTRKADPVIAKISFVFDDVKVQRKGKDALLEAAVNMPMYAGDSLLTLSNRARAEITFENGHISRLSGLSKLILEFSKTDPNNHAEVTLLNLISGKVLIEVKKLVNHDEVKSQFELKTPVAVTAVKGTHFMTTYLDGKSEVKVIEGVVVVANKKGLGGTEIPAGMKTAVTAEALPAAATALTPDDYKDINKLQTEIKKNRGRSPYPNNDPNKKTLNIRFFNFGKSDRP
jgi:hypothetical protein